MASRGTNDCILIDNGVECEVYSFTRLTRLLLGPQGSGCGGFDVRRGFFRRVPDKMRVLNILKYQVDGLRDAAFLLAASDALGAALNARAGGSHGEAQ